MGIQFEDEFSLVEWPSEQTADIDWAYLGIIGEGFVESASVAVSASMVRLSSAKSRGPTVMSPNPRFERDRPPAGFTRRRPSPQA